MGAGNVIMKLKFFFYFFGGNFTHVIVIFDCQFGIEKGPKTGNERSLHQMFCETHKKFSTPEIA